MKLFNDASNLKNLSVKGKLKFLFRDSLYFGGLRAINIIFPLLTIPILTRYFTIEDYGLYDSLLVLSHLIFMTMVLGQDSAVARWFYQVEGRKLKQMVVSESLIIQLAIAIILIPGLILFRQELSIFYLHSTEYSLVIVLILVYSLLLLINNFTINILKWTYARKEYAVISILRPFLILISLLFVIVSAGNIIALIISNGIGLYFCRKWIIIPPKFMYIRKLLYYGIPLGVITLTSSLVPAISRKMMASTLNLESIGIYALAYKISAIILMIDGVFHMAWGPFSMSIFKQKDAEVVYNLVLKILFMILIFSVLMIKLSAPFLVKTLGTSEYVQATTLILPLGLALMINSISGITGIGISLSMKTSLNYIPFLISTLIFIGLLYLLIPLYQLKGIAFSLLIANITKMILVSFIARKVYSDIRVNFESIFVFFVLFGLSYYLYFEYQLGAVMNIVLGCSMCLLVIYILFNQFERNYVLARLRSMATSNK
jgi:O-antigen/teichoic acid export membrane protein